MQRVMIVGGPGSGKSTLARELGTRTGLPVFHMDQIHWQPGWVERSKDEKDRLSSEVHRQDRWIFEGGHSRTYAERIARADTFIWLDVPVTLRTIRVLRRSWVYRGQSRPDLPEGCTEQFNGRTVEFLKFIWDTRHSSRAKLLEVWQSPPAHLTLHRFTRLHEVRQFLASLEKEQFGQGLTGTSPDRG